MRGSGRQPSHLPAALRTGLAVLVLGLGLGGCASVSIKEQKLLDGKQPTTIPKKIFIRPFSFQHSGMVVDRRGEALAEFETALSKDFSRELIKRLDNTIAPAEEMTPHTRLPTGNYWLIIGHFTRVSQGSRLLRILIGLGSGGTKLDCETYVYSLSQSRLKPFLRIRTTGGSNISPGAITGLTPVGIGLNAAAGLPTGLTYDTARTAHEINAALSCYLAKHGAIPQDEALYPKRLGKFPNLRFQQFIHKKPPPQKTGDVTVVPAPTPTSSPAAKPSTTPVKRSN